MNVYPYELIATVHLFAYFSDIGTLQLCHLLYTDLICNTFILFFKCLRLSEATKGKCV